VSIVVDAAAFVLVAIAALHVAWAAGLRWGTDVVIPTRNGTPTLSPSAGATRWLFRLGSGAVASVLLLRALGDRRAIGLTKRVRGTRFSRYDDVIFVPLCVALAVAGLVAVAR